MGFVINKHNFNQASNNHHGNEVRHGITSRNNGQHICTCTWFLENMLGVYEQQHVCSSSNQTNSKQNSRASWAELGLETAWDFIIKQQYGNHMATNIHDAHIANSKTTYMRWISGRK